MLTLKEKISYLKKSLTLEDDSYADSFKPLIYMYIFDFTENNPDLKFLEDLSTKKEIKKWITELTSRLDMKEEDETIGNIIVDYFALG